MSQPGCAGARIPPNEGCLGHLAPDQVATYLREVARGNELDGRGVQFSKQLLHRVFAGNFLGRIPAACFDGATFEGDTNFDGMIFEGDIHFRGAHFLGNTSFDGAVFKRSLDLQNTTFGGNLILSKARFESTHHLGPFLVRKHLVLDRAVFERAVVIDAAAFGVTCDMTIFAKGVTLLLGPRSHLIFERSTLGGSSFVGQSNHFTLKRDLERDPDESDFDFFIRQGAAKSDDENYFYAEDWFDKSPALLDDVICSVSSRESESYMSYQFHLFDSARPRVLSLRETDVAGLTISHVDLAACRFVGAFNLDRLRLEGGPALFSVARGGRWTTGRQSIVEEQLYRRRLAFVQYVSWKPNRSTVAFGSRNANELFKLQDVWFPARCRVPRSLESFLKTMEPPEAEEVVSAYRGLRKAREDIKDEPGAADFYYGEMEMRRLSPWTRRGERLLLWLYRIVSGYGVRASRALISLAVTVVAFALLLERWGFRERKSLLSSLLFSAQSTTSLLRPPDLATTEIGDWINLTLRLLGPLFFGLFLVSLRARIKR